MVVLGSGGKELILFIVAGMCCVLNSVCHQYFPSKVLVVAEQCQGLTRVGQLVLGWA